MENKFTEKESLALITDMIALAKGNAKQSFFHIILWGWVIIAISLAQFYLLRFTSIQHSEWVWLLTFPAGIVSFIYGYRKGRKERPDSFIDSMYMWIWMVLVISLVLVIIISAKNWLLITPLILVLAGGATFLSGKLIRFKPLIWGGLAFWAWSLLAYFLYNEFNLLVNAVAIFTGYIIPGYMLKHKLSKDVVQET